MPCLPEDSRRIRNPGKGYTDLGLVSYRVVEDQTDSDKPVTYLITVSDNAGKPAVFASLPVEKYNHENASVEWTKKGFSVVYGLGLGCIDNPEDSPVAGVTGPGTDGKQWFSAPVSGDEKHLFLPGVTTGLLLVRVEGKDGISVIMIVR